MNAIDIFIVLVLGWILSVIVGCTGWQMTLRVDDVESQSKVTSFRDEVTQRSAAKEQERFSLK